MYYYLNVYYQSRLIFFCIVLFCFVFSAQYVNTWSNIQKMETYTGVFNLLRHLALVWPVILQYEQTMFVFFFCLLLVVEVVNGWGCSSRTATVVSNFVSIFCFGINKNVDFSWLSHNFWWQCGHSIGLDIAFISCSSGTVPVVDGLMDSMYLLIVCSFES